METLQKALEVADRNRQKAYEIIGQTGICRIWESVGAKVNLVGSLRTGLLVKSRDIDFHIYSAPLTVAESFRAMSQLARNPRIRTIQYGNLIDTQEACIEWHATYLHPDGELWKIDMIHILTGSAYDGYMERVADRILEVMTPEMKQAILCLKYETPEMDPKPMGIEYYVAVIRDGVRTWPEFVRWRKEHPAEGVVEWIP